MINCDKYIGPGGGANGGFVGSDAFLKDGNFNPTEGTQIGNITRKAILKETITPTKVPTLGNPYYIFSIGSLLFVTNTTDILCFRIDVFGELEYISNLSLPGTLGSKDSLFDDNYIYLPTLSNSVKKINYRDPSNMSYIDWTHADLTNTRAVERAGDYVFISSSDNRIIVFNRDTDEYVKTITDVNLLYCTSMVRFRKYLICAIASPARILFIDVEDPVESYVFHSADLTGMSQIQRIKVYDNYLQVLGDQELAFYSLTDIEGFSESSLIGKYTDAQLINSQDFTAFGDYSLVPGFANGKILLINHTDKATPVLVDSPLQVTTPGQLRSAHQVGNYAYIGDSQNTALYITDVNGFKFTTVEIDSLLVKGGTELLGGLHSEQLDRFKPDLSSTFQKQSLSTGTQKGITNKKPILISDVDVTEPRKIVTVGSLLFCITATSIRSYLIGPVGSLIYISELIRPALGGVENVYVDHNSLYIAAPGFAPNEIIKVNFSNPSNMVIDWVFADVNLVAGYGVTVHGDVVITGNNDSSGKLFFIDRETGALIKEFTDTTNLKDIRSLAIYNKVLITGNSNVSELRFSFLDITDPTNPSLINSVLLAGIGVEVGSIQVFNNIMELILRASDVGGEGRVCYFSLTDIPNFSASDLIGSISHEVFLGCRDFYCMGNYSIFATWSKGQAQIVNHTDRTNPTLVPPLDLGVGKYLYSVGGQDNYAYFANETDAKVQIVDVHGFHFPTISTGSLTAHGKITANKGMDIDGDMTVGSTLNASEINSSGNVYAKNILQNKSIFSGTQKVIIDKKPLLIDDVTVLNPRKIITVGSLLFCVTTDFIRSYLIGPFGSLTFISELDLELIDTSMESVYVDHDSIYLAVYQQNKIIKVNFSDPGNMVIDWEFTNTNLVLPYGVTAHGDVVITGNRNTDGKLFFIDRETGVLVKEFTDTTNLKHIHSLAIYNKVLITGNYSGTELRFSFVDITDPTNPSLINSVPIVGLGFYVGDLQVFNNIMEVLLRSSDVGGEGRVCFFNLTDIPNFSIADLIGSISNEVFAACRDFYVIGDYSIFATSSNGQAQIVNHTDRANPILVPPLDLGVGKDLYSVGGRDNYAYFANGTDNKVHIINVHGYYFPSVATGSLTAHGKITANKGIDIDGDMTVGSTLSSDEIFTRIIHNRNVSLRTVSLNRKEDIPYVPGTGYVCENYTIYEGNTAGFAIVFDDDIIVEEYTYLRDVRIQTGSKIIAKYVATPTPTCALKMNHVEIIYTGLTNCLEIENAQGVTILDTIGFYAVNNTTAGVKFLDILNADASSVITFFKVFVRQSYGLGTVRGGVVDFLSSQFFNFYTGFVFQSPGIVSLRSVNSIAPNALADVAGVFLNFQGNISRISAAGVMPTLFDSQNAVHIDIASSHDSISFNGCVPIYANPGASFFTSTSLNEKDLKVSVIGCPPVSDSTILGSALLEDNTQLNTSNAPAEWQLIETLITNEFSSPYTERMSLANSKYGLLKYLDSPDIILKANNEMLVNSSAAGKTLTFKMICIDPTLYVAIFGFGGVITTAVYEQTNGQAITFVDGGGTLPTELFRGTIYFVVNSVGFTFQVAYTPGGTPIDFPLGGSSDFRHVTFHDFRRQGVFTSTYTSLSSSALISVCQNGQIGLAGQHDPTTPVNFTMKDAYYQLSK